MIVSVLTVVLPVVVVHLLTVSLENARTDDDR